MALLASCAGCTYRHVGVSSVSLIRCAYSLTHGLRALHALHCPVAYCHRTWCSCVPLEHAKCSSQVRGRPGRRAQGARRLVPLMALPRQQDIWHQDARHTAGKRGTKGSVCCTPCPCLHVRLNISRGQLLCLGCLVARGLSRPVHTPPSERSACRPCVSSISSSSPRKPGCPHALRLPPPHPSPPCAWVRPEAAAVSPLNRPRRALQQPPK